MAKCVSKMSLSCCGPLSRVLNQSLSLADARCCSAVGRLIPARVELFVVCVFCCGLKWVPLMSLAICVSVLLSFLALFGSKGHQVAQLWKSLERKSDFESNVLESILSEPCLKSLWAISCLAVLVVPILWLISGVKLPLLSMTVPRYVYV